MPSAFEEIMQYTIKKLIDCILSTDISPKYYLYLEILIEKLKMIEIDTGLDISISLYNIIVLFGEKLIKKEICYNYDIAACIIIINNTYSGNDISLKIEKFYKNQ